MDRYENLDLQHAINWMTSQVSETPYGGVVLRIVTHDGHIQRIERTVEIKSKPTPPPARKQ